MQALGIRRALALVALSCAACAAPQKQSVDDTGFLPSSGLEQLRPVDIAVAVVIDRVEDAAVPVDGLRQALYDGLPDRLYTPLPLAWVDGGGDADATLSVVITAWDTSRLASAGTLVARATVRMRPGPPGAGSAGDAPLWAVDMTREVNVNSFGPARNDGEVALRRAVEGFAARVLELLPERDPLRTR